MRWLLLPLLSITVGASLAAAQSVVFDFTSTNGNWAPGGAGGSGAAAWQYGSPGNPGGSPTGWFTSGQSNVGSYFIESPVLFVISNGGVSGQFSHRFNFEGGFDGGQLQFSVNGGGFNTVPENLIVGGTYNSTIAGGFGSPIAGERAFSGQSPNFLDPAFAGSTFTLGTGAFPFATGAASAFAAGDQIVLRYTGAWDLSNVNASPNWHVIDTTIGNVQLANVPEPTTIALGGLGLAGAGMGFRRWRTRRLSAKAKAAAVPVACGTTLTGGRLVRLKVKVKIRGPR